MERKIESKTKKGKMFICVLEAWYVKSDLGWGSWASLAFRALLWAYWQGDFPAIPQRAPRLGLAPTTHMLLYSTMVLLSQRQENGAGSACTTSRCQCLSADDQRILCHTLVISGHLNPGGTNSCQWGQSAYQALLCRMVQNIRT